MRTTTSPVPPVSTAARHEDDATVDRMLADLAVPVADRPSLMDRAVVWARELTGTRLRAAACTGWLFAMTVAIATAATQPTVTVRSTLGSGSARCGLDVYLYGHPDQVVETACRDAAAVRFWLFVPAAIVVVAGIAAAIVLAGRGEERSGFPSVWSVLRHDRRRGGLVAVGAIAFVVGVFALRPALTEFTRNGQLVSARCGVDSYLFGYPDPRVEDACRHAYAGHAYVLVAAVVVMLAGLMAFAHALASAASTRWSPRRLLLVGAAVAMTVFGLIALRPVTITVPDGRTPAVANCGLDTYLGGYPDDAVEDACRRRYGSHAAAGVAALAVALLLVVLQRLAGNMPAATAVGSEPESSIADTEQREPIAAPRPQEGRL